MKKIIPSKELQAVLGSMQTMTRSGRCGGKLGTVHATGSVLHGLIKDRSRISVEVGKKGSERSRILSLPFITTTSMMEHLPLNARIGVALGQAMAGMPVNIYPDAPEELKEILKTHDPMVIGYFGPDRSGLDIGNFRKADIIEVDIVDRSNGIPRLVPEVQKGKDLKKLFDLLSEITAAPKMVVIDDLTILSDIDFYLLSEMDILALRCYSDPILSCDDAFTMASIVRVNSQMEVFKSREIGVKVLVNSGPETPSDMIKLMALGADLIGLDIMTIRFIEAYLRTRLGLPSEESVDIKRYDDDIDWAEIGELYCELIEHLSEGIIDGLTRLNIGSIKDLCPDNLVTTSYDTASITGIKLAGFGAPAPFWRHRS